MNFTANCSITTDWLTAQQSITSLQDASVNASESIDSINVAFLRATLPTEFSSFSDFVLTDLYDQLRLLNPHIWLKPAKESIQAGCLAPDLTRNLSFEELELTSNCISTAAYYGNSMCAINGLQQSYTSYGTLETIWKVETFGEFQWIVGRAPIQGLNSTIGLAMLRNALPFQYRNISDIELEAWANLVGADAEKFTDEPQAAEICKACLFEFCGAAGLLETLILQAEA
jgi:hypothetical protein